MGTAIEKLTKLADTKDRFAYSHTELRDTQVEALNERFQSRVNRIRLLGHRAQEAGLTQIRSLEVAVPLLFPHTAYKSYPESFLADGKWDRLGKWLGTVSTYPIPSIETSDIADIDDWIARLEENGLFIACSSGTTGKSAIFSASAKDMAWARMDGVMSFSWSSGVQPTADRQMMGLAPVADISRVREMGNALEQAFCDPVKEAYHLNVPPITIGQLTQMVVLRKKMVEGTALPEEIAALEQTGKERMETMNRALAEAAEKLVHYRRDKLMVGGMWASLYPIARMVRDRGYSGKDFHPDNCVYVGGGLKGAELPDDYQEFVHETLNIPAERAFHFYSMQELNSTMPRCRKSGRYHLPPWVVPLVLDESGENLLPYNSDGEIEGRAAFFDLALDGRWGGVISGDRISLDFRPCACGNASPSIRDDIVRYTDIKGDDKIACSGTVDAYVRGI